MLNKKIEEAFASNEGRALFQRINQYITENNIDEYLPSGVLVGFSGGPDSVMLLSFLCEYRRRGADFKIVACHINHMLRGDDADMDERFSARFAESLGVEFISKRVDVTSLSKKLGMGVEEAAREARYSAFDEIIQGRKDIKYIATAHNMGDNFETAFFNILRGAGTLGASGIAPIRDNIVRPMLSVSKPDILSLLDKFGIEYCIDKTNLTTDYTRNFIRNEISPLLLKKFPSYEEAFLRFTENMRESYAFVSAQAKDFLKGRSILSNKELLSLPKALFSEVVCLFVGARLNRDTVGKLSLLLRSDNFSYDLPGCKRFLCERGVCKVVSNDEAICDYRYSLKLGFNEFSGFSSVIYISDEPLPKTYLNIYKISIQDRISSAIINGEMYIRPRKEGDTLYYGGMTHKIKKMLCDRKIPNSLKNFVPVFCDSDGPFYLPGYHARDLGVKSEKNLFVYILDREGLEGNKFYTGKDFG